MRVAEHLTRLGGVARRHELEACAGRAALEAAVAAGTVRRVARGRYALPTDDEARAAAHRLSGTVVLLSAAAHWGWATKVPAGLPQVAVPRGRKVPADVQREVDIRWRSVPPAQRVDGWVTSKARTVHDCAALLPFDEALCVLDSALRFGDVSPVDLHDLTEVPPRMRPRIQRVLDCGSDLAFGPFETVLRAIALDVPGLDVRPQVAIRDADGFVGRVDLADERLRIVIEADSHAFHAGAADFARDCERYSRLTCDGWIVIRVPWRMAMHEPERVRRLLERAVALRTRCLICAIS
ncbi:hypothetical protein [Phycicoccus flavus]|uniref:hypothetical protein n=1 Tax=Phycicoccus flavus TaxID=2502783 RepID=UPI000FEBFC9B|nr:hypothetical protein [Phycicoccus flavus]NHA67871.1 hypothetical protein [Phycicoccus flavus]